ncbi:hypothetical protein GCM10022267_74390 [Lentzea roselyniae]|uniref:Uncharacterized protein n=1 Tax=Lentzea roselyniae TaxID=531940 RepID=A0ABP7C513_9PSEU
MLGYRLFTELGGDRRYVQKLAHEQWHAWLKSKNYNADALELGSLVDLGGGGQGQLLELAPPDGSKSFRARLVENKPGGAWVTQLTVHVPQLEKRSPWLWLDIESPQDQYASPPRVARSLLEVLEGRDRESRLGFGPTKIGPDDVRGVVESVWDPDRRGLLFVAGSDERLDVRNWHGYVQKLLKDTVGMAAAYVLDPEATRKFNNAVGDLHSVAPWTLRTFRPGVEADDPVDAERHRVLGTDRIVHDSAKYLARMLGRRAREAVLETPLPKSVLKVDHAFERLIDENLVAPLTEPVLPVPRQPVVAELPTVTDDLRAAITVLQDALGWTEITAENVRELTKFALAEQQQRADNQAAITARLRDREERLGKALEERDQLRTQLEYAAGPARRGRGTGSCRGEDGLSPQAARTERSRGRGLVRARDRHRSHPPSRLRELARRYRPVRRSGVHRRSGACAGARRAGPQWCVGGKIWDVFAVLDDYVQAKAAGKCDRDVDGYLGNTPAGYRSYSRQRHARDESEDVRNNPKFRAARELPTGDGSKVFMGAHFKIATSGMISPRLHYHDDTAKSSKVYVGYIGRHLPTKKTN